MNTFPHLSSVLTAWLLLAACSVSAAPLTGRVAVDTRLYFRDPAHGAQVRDHAALVVQPRFVHAFGDHYRLTVEPMLRIDSADHRRTLLDAPELNVLYQEEHWHLRTGMHIVHWGATEFVPLIDVINQTDLVAHVDGKTKLGQPMIEFSLLPPIGKLDLYLMPYFRERTFPGRRGRLRPEPLIDMRHPLYESGSPSDTLDLAARFSHSAGPADFGLHIFQGRGRDPLLVPSDLIPEVAREPAPDAPVMLVPFYEDIRQIGLDLQWAGGRWLWKLEALRREGFADSFFAATGGFEYALPYPLARSEIGILLEYAYDERGKTAASTSIFDNDVFLGLRVEPQDLRGARVLAGWMSDLDGAEHLLSIEASRRMGENTQLTLETWVLLFSRDSLLHDIRRDDFIRLQWTRFF